MNTLPVSARPDWHVAMGCDRTLLYRAGLFAVVRCKPADGRATRPAFRAFTTKGPCHQGCSRASQGVSSITNVPRKPRQVANPYIKEQAVVLVNGPPDTPL